MGVIVFICKYRFFCSYDHIHSKMIFLTPLYVTRYQIYYIYLFINIYQKRVTCDEHSCILTMSMYNKDLIENVYAHYIGMTFLFFYGS